MTADVRVALLGPHAEAWRGALSERIQERLAGPEESVVWVVDWEDIPTEVPRGCHVIVFALGGAPESDLPDLWETVETPERWVPAMFAALAEGRSLEAALKIGGPTPIRLAGKDPGLKKIITPRNKAANPHAKEGPGVKKKLAHASK